MQSATNCIFGVFQLPFLVKLNCPDVFLFGGEDKVDVKESSKLDETVFDFTGRVV